MAVSWSFALLLILTLVALITFSQPLFQSTPAAAMGHTHADLETVPQAAVARRAPRHNLLTSKASDVGSSGDGAWSFGLLRGSRSQRWTRKLIQRDVSPPCSEQQRQVICRGKRKLSVQRSAHSGDTNPPAGAKSGISRRSISANFESDRMVPTGPNPLHNSNRSQVIFP